MGARRAGCRLGGERVSALAVTHELGSAVSVMLLIFSSLGILLYMRALRRVEAARS